MQLLTKENAPNVKLIRNIKNPEWGDKRFNYSDQELNDGARCSSFGVGCNSALLFENEFHFWEVIK